MPKCRCPCGAKYRVAEEAIGKNAKCKKCGEVFTLEPEDEGTIPIADEVANVSQQTSLATADAPGGSPARFDPSTLPPPVIERVSHPADETTGKVSTYVGSIFSAFLFLSSLHNALTFVVLWVVFFVCSVSVVCSVCGVC